MVRLLILLLAVALSQPAAGRDSDALSYSKEFFPGTQVDPTISKPEELLGFRVGDRAAFPAEIEACLLRWAEESPRAELVEYARSYEDRPLHYMIVSSRRNLERLDEIKEGIGQLADPRGLSAAAGAALIESQPAIAWMAYSIHGDETSGSDSSLEVLYHLLAATNPEVTRLLDEVVVLVDPVQNPDGRQRFLQQLAEHRAVAANVDDQSLLHRGYWPWGRTNHYLFDLNRDWILGVNPESRGRIAAAGSWHPQLMVDAHEMGPQDTYLFSPARPPLNPHLPAWQRPWASTFARDQSVAFDRYQWLYYTGEWNEGWYPGYTDTWGGFRGAIGILYEQASFAEDGVRQLGGKVVTYREAVHHQAVSSMANLQSLVDNRTAILSDYLKGRRTNVGPDGPYARRIFAILPSANQSRIAAFLDLMELQGFEIYSLGSDTEIGASVDSFGRSRSRTVLPAGAFLIPNRQPEANLIAAMLEFDGRMSADYLERERTAILKTGSSTIYDMTAWNVPMLFGLEAMAFDAAKLPADVERYQQADPRAEKQGVVDQAVAWIVEGASDHSVRYAAQLLESGIEVRVANRDVELGRHNFSRGSVVVTPSDNPMVIDLPRRLEEVAGELGLHPIGVETGLGEGDLPDLGGGHFVRLETPRIALLARDDVNAYDYGSIWHTLDQELGIGHSQLDASRLRSVDLRRYNVLVVPDRRRGSLDASVKSMVRNWVEAGGTLIAISRSAAELATETSNLSEVRRLENVGPDLESYEQAVLREDLARSKQMLDDSEVWSQLAAAAKYPWDGLAELPRSDVATFVKQDEWNRMFMPQGAFLAARTDPEHWLTFGVGEELPMLVGGDHVLMAKQPVEVAARLGVYETNEGAELRRVGWSPVTAGRDLRLRLSGLLWPEAAVRLANSAAVTRERVGNGQVILFANPPTFRAATRGTARLLLNAMIYGPGFGANPPVLP